MTSLLKMQHNRKGNESKCERETEREKDKMHASKQLTEMNLRHGLEIQLLSHVSRGEPGNYCLWQPTAALPSSHTVCYSFDPDLFLLLPTFPVLPSCHFLNTWTETAPIWAMSYRHSGRKAEEGGVEKRGKKTDLSTNLASPAPRSSAAFLRAETPFIHFLGGQEYKRQNGHQSEATHW